jgi:hypothetical protein
MRLRLKFGLGGVLALVLVAVMAFGPLVRARAAEQAERRGVALEIGAVRPGLGKVWLREIEARIPEAPAIEAHFDAIEVGVGLGLGLRYVVVHGGRVSIRGSPESVAAELGAWRERRASTGGGEGRRMPLEIRGLELVWSGAFDGGERDVQQLWGVHFRSEPDGSEELSTDLARLWWRSAAVELQNARVSIARPEGRRVIERVVADAVLASLNLDQTSLPDVLADGRGTTRTVSLPAPPGRGPPGAVALSRRLNELLPLDPGRGSRVREMLRRAARTFALVLPESGELDLGGMRLIARRGDQRLGIGPARLRVTRRAEQIAVSLVPGEDASPEQTRLRLALELPIQEGPVRLAVSGGSVTLAALGVQEGDLGLSGVDAARLELTGSTTLSDDGGRLAWDGSGKLTGVSIRQKWLAPGPVTEMDLGWRGRGSLALDGGRLDIEQAEVGLGELGVNVAGFVEKSADHVSLSLTGQIPLASCQSMLDSLPRGLAPLLYGMKMSGTFAFSGSLKLDTRQLDRMLTRWNAANDCRITATSAEVSPRRFQAPWRREVKDAGGRVVAVDSGPGTPGWVPRYQVSRHMETAVLICEDGGFFRHRGFDEEAIRNSIRENVKAGRFVRGASTISMQLAKNLYLSRDKTLSRKLQEAVLTMLLEQELSKDQILELYLNVIELGPGVYGIGPAAWQVFGAPASSLSLGQSLYLASILPNPARSYFGAGGQVTPGWSGYLRKLMHIAKKIRRITDEELEEALLEQVSFQVPHSPRARAGSEMAELSGEAEPAPPESWEANPEP